MSAATKVSFFITTAAVAFALGLVLPREQGAAPAPVAVAAPAPVTRVVYMPAPAEATDGDRVGTAEVAPLRPEAEVADEVAPPSPGPEVSQARAVVDNALAAGRWSEADRAALRPLMARLHPEERNALLATLAPAINEGRLKIDVRGFPF